MFLWLNHLSIPRTFLLAYSYTFILCYFLYFCFFQYSLPNSPNYSVPVDYLSAIFGKTTPIAECFLSFPFSYNTTTTTTTTLKAILCLPRQVKGNLRRLPSSCLVFIPFADWFGEVSFFFDHHSTKVRPTYWKQTGTTITRALGMHPIVMKWGMLPKWSESPEGNIH